MNYIKTLLFALLASILFFVYLEVEKTDNSLLRIQGSKQNVHIMYRNGKRIKISDEEYAKIHESHTAPTKEAKNIEKRTKTSEIKTLKLSGNIPKGLDYTIKTYYESDSKGSICGKTQFSFGLFSEKKGFYLTNATKSVSYSPTLKDGHHSIEVPLDKFRNPLSCKYHLSSVYMLMKNGNTFKLFFPKGTASKHITNGDPYNHNVGKIIDIECTKKALKKDIAYMSPNCHLKSTIDSFFVVQELNYSDYNLNFSTNSQKEYQLKIFLKSQDFIQRVKFLKSISKYPKLKEKKLADYTYAIKKLNSYQSRVLNYLLETKEKLNTVLKNEKDEFTDKEIKVLKDKLKTIAISIKSQKSIGAIEKELLYNANNKAELDRLNNKVQIEKYFSINEFYKYEMLHLANLSMVTPNVVSNKMYKINTERSKVHNSFSRFFLHLKKENSKLSKKLEGINSTEKEADIKKLLKHMRAIEDLLFLSNRNINYLLHILEDHINDNELS